MCYSYDRYGRKALCLGVMRIIRNGSQDYQFLARIWYGVVVPIVNYVMPTHWRCLNHAIWSDVPVVKMLAIAMLQQVAEEEPWALALFEQVYLTDDELRWQAQITLP